MTETDKDEIKERRKKYRDAHKDEINLKNKAYRESHKEQIKAYNQTYKSEHKEQNAEHSAQYRDKHKDIINCNQCGKPIVEYSKATHQRLRCAGTLHLDLPT